MRYAKAPPNDVRFLPGLVVVEFVAPEHLSARKSIVVRARENTTCALHAIYVGGLS